MINISTNKHKQFLIIVITVWFTLSGAISLWLWSTHQKINKTNDKDIKKSVVILETKDLIKASELLSQ